MLMTRKQLRIAQCPHPHTCKVDGEWQRGENEAPGILISETGVASWKMRCRGCGRRSEALSRKTIAAWGVGLDQVEWLIRNQPTRQPDPCIIPSCPNQPTEIHHFAPTNVFGADADRWPCLPLCRPHHLEWHQRMDGYRWQAKRVVA